MSSWLLGSLFWRLVLGAEWLGGLLLAVLALIVVGVVLRVSLHLTFEAKQERQRQLSNARVRRWRENHPELARQRTREAMRDYRARKKQEGS